jgi:lipoprotein-anchoring transpeptidase ErfK/SrfK
VRVVLDRQLHHPGGRLVGLGPGDGQIALHGTADVGDLGQQVSNGCVRIANEILTRLAETLASAPQ